MLCSRIRQMAKKIRPGSPQVCQQQEMRAKPGRSCFDMLGEKPEQAAPPDMLFSDAVRRWLEDVRHRVDEVTYQGYEVQARAHILPYFDDLQIRLCDVDGVTLQTYINVKAKFGRSDGHGGLSAVSLRQHKNVLNQTLKLAQRDGLIQTNPADLVVMPHAAQLPARSTPKRRCETC